MKGGFEVLVGRSGLKREVDKSKRLRKIVKTLLEYWAEKIVVIYKEDEDGNWDWRTAQSWCFEGCRVHHNGEYHIVYVPK